MQEEIYPLFPTTVLKTNIERQFTKQEIDYISNVQNFASQKNIGNSASIDKFIFKNEELKSLHNDCLNKVGQYIKQIMQPSEDAQIRAYITQSWLNFNKKGDYHHQHDHPNSFISGVLYISAEDDLIEFHNSNKSQLNLTFNKKEYNIYNSPSWWIKVKTGDLILFPSSLQHSVPEKKDEKTRISLSFNTFVKGNFGSCELASELIL